MERRNHMSDQSFQRAMRELCGAPALRSPRSTGCRIRSDPSPGEIAPSQYELGRTGRLLGAPGSGQDP
jgi:hypothetical protein